MQLISSHTRTHFCVFGCLRQRQSVSVCVCVRETVCATVFVHLRDSVCVYVCVCVRVFVSVTGLLSQALLCLLVWGTLVGFLAGRMYRACVSPSRFLLLRKREPLTLDL